MSNRSTKYPVNLESLVGVIESVLNGDSIILLGDFNTHVANDSNNWRGGTASLIGS